MKTSTPATPPADWKPALELDLNTASATAMAEFIEQFRKWSDQQPRSKIVWTTGWHIINRYLAEDLLRRNRQNRKVSLGTVRNYARAMQAGQWVPTGQPGIINENGELIDFQHRLLAVYLSGAEIVIYIVADVPAHPDLFAYIDGGKPRSLADALYTAGSNGQSGPISQAVQLAVRYESRALGINKQPAFNKLTPPEGLAYQRANPALSDAAHMLAANFSQAAAVIKDKGVGAFVVAKIFELHGPDVLEAFMNPLGSGANLDEHSPILALRNRLIAANAGEGEAMSKERRLALLIKAFNMYVTGQMLGRNGLFLRDNEKYPLFENVNPTLPMIAAQ